YMERVFGVSDNIKNYLLLAVLLMSATGGIVSGWIADKIGALKTLKFILIGWIILIPLIATSKSLISLSIFSSLVGLLIGSVFAVTRAYLSEILKKEELGYGFSFYTIAERFAMLFGPLTYGGIIAILGTQHTSYRIAMLSMVVFVIIGLVILSKWKRETKFSNV
ncbi:MAG: MFS transporter, partial [Patescibacteria group bacterium]